MMRVLLATAGVQAVSGFGSQLMRSGLRTSAIRMVRCCHVGLRAAHPRRRAPMPIASPRDERVTIMNRSLPQLRALRTRVRSQAAVGDKFPAVSVDFGFPPEKVDMTKRLAGKKVIVVGLPGAFTPT